MAEVKFGDTVKVHYSIRLEDNSVFDSTFNAQPFQFTIGQGQVIPGFEQAIIGMSPGTSKTIKVPSDEAFGPHREELIVEVDRNLFPPELKLEIGQHLQIPQPDSQPIIATVVNLTESKVILDENHPLAGKDLIIDIQLLEIV